MANSIRINESVTAFQTSDCKWDLYQGETSIGLAMHDYVVSGIDKETGKQEKKWIDWVVFLSPVDEQPSMYVGWGDTIFDAYRDAVK